MARGFLLKSDGTRIAIFTHARQMGEKVEGPGLGSREGRDRGGPNVRRIASVGRLAAFNFHQVEPDRLYIRAQIERLDLQHVMQFRHRALRHPPTRSLRTVSGTPPTLSAPPARNGSQRARRRMPERAMTELHYV